MRIEALCTGDELVTGLVVDTNSAHFMTRLLELGARVSRVQSVGDVHEEITQTLREAAGRADVLLVSGGLGPTADDITAECAAAAAEVALVEDERVFAALKERFAARGLPLTPNNARQARVPAGSEVVLNPVGSAPLFIQRIGRCTLFFVPGVPREYRALLDQHVLPRIRSMLEARGELGFVACRLLRTVALPESHLDAMVEPVAREHPRVIFGFRTMAPENHLKLMATGTTREQAERLVDAAALASRKVLGAFAFGEGEMTLARAVGNLLREGRHSLSVAESCTGGLLADLITTEPGASDFFLGSAVTYQDATKKRWVGVEDALLKKAGAVSAEVAEAMAFGVREVLGATFGVSVTGYAGPAGGTAADPVGTVYLGLSGPNGTHVVRRVVPGDRERVRRFAAFYSLEMLRRELLGLERLP